MAQTERRTEKLQAIAVEWDDAGLRWVLLRGKATIDDPRRDIDLLVAEDDMVTLETIVRRHGGLAYPRWAHPRARRFRVGELELDVVTRLAYGRRRPVQSGLEAGCLERRVRDEWLWQLAPTDAFWTILLHCLLDKDVITERRARELQAAAELVVRHGPAEQVAAQILPAPWSPNRVLELVEVGRWREVEKLSGQLGPPASRSAALRRAGDWSRAVAAGLVVRASRGRQ